MRTQQKTLVLKQMILRMVQCGSYADLLVMEDQMFSVETPDIRIYYI